MLAVFSSSPVVESELPLIVVWLIVAGFLGMASKFVECTLGVKYRQMNADGSVSGGPMFCMDKGLAERRLPRLGKAMAWYCVLRGAAGRNLAREPAADDLRGGHADHHGPWAAAGRSGGRCR
jgi:hypothetical protein